MEKIKTFGWLRDHEGIHCGSFGLKLTGRDPVKLGELYRQGGVYNGRRMLDESFVSGATRAQSGDLPGFDYGYLWWVTPIGTTPAYSAIGLFMSESASVEVLSAEAACSRLATVRSRALYRQLDKATCERFEPFGRVRADKRNLMEGVLQLVGRDNTTRRADPLRRLPARLVNQGGAFEFAQCWAAPNMRGRTRFTTVRKDAVWSGPGRGTGFVVLTRYQRCGGGGKSPAAG